MIVKTLFKRQGFHQTDYELGEVEVQLLPGIPMLHVIGLPDTAMRESGIRLKSALRSCGLKWPKGHQIVVNLRPSYVRKASSGIDLAIALGFLALTGQLPPEIKEQVVRSVIYGEVTLNGEIYAPRDVNRVLSAVSRIDAIQKERGQLLTGALDKSVQARALSSVEWLEISGLLEPQLRRQKCLFGWRDRLRAPQFPEDLHFPESAARLMALSVHSSCHVLVAGPQGSGKSTWARAFYALTPAPSDKAVNDLAELFGDALFDSLHWRPCEQPHHTVTTQAMVGGGVPLQPGIITRAHGGVLIMDEFLEFPPAVLEALREPMENGVIEVARKGVRARFPAQFQLVATTNLCPCGQLEPRLGKQECSRGARYCRSVCARLSGPVLDRFDLLVFSHDWLSAVRNRERMVSFSQMREWVHRLSEFARKREPVEFGVSRKATHLESYTQYSELQISHRRRQSMLRIARALADFEEEYEVKDRHLAQAAELTQAPMDSLRQIFA